MAFAKRGDTVKIHYKGLLEDGTVFASSFNRKPYEFTLGKGEMIPRIENEMLVMHEGDKKRVRVAAADAFGKRKSSLVMAVEKSKIPSSIKTKAGEKLKVKAANGNLKTATITHIKGDTVIIDANHPLAGKDLIFEIQLIEIV